MAEQVDIIDHGDLGGTMRLGLYEAALEPGSIVAELYGSDTVSERHRHRYEVNNHYRDRIADGRDGVLGRLARPRARRVRRAAARGAPVLRRHPGAPRAAVATEPRRIRCSAGWSRAALERQQAIAPVRGRRAGERPVELHDAEGVATRCRRRASAAQHVEV